VGAAYHQVERLASDDDKESAVGAAYKFDQLGGFEIKANWMQADREGAAKYKQVNLGGSIPFGAHRFFVNVQQQKQAAAKGNSWALAYTWSLSKRTNVYATYASLDNNNTGAFGLTASTPTVAAASAGKDPSVFSLGLRHSF
jgi:predicted porin